MARPRIFRTKDGSEISIKNGTPELYAAINATLNPGSTAPAQVEEAPEETPEPGAVNKENCKSVAVGCFSEPGRGYGVSVIRFNHLTKEAYVESSEISGEARVSAKERFKIVAIQKGAM